MLLHKNLITLSIFAIISPVVFAADAIESRFCCSGSGDYA